MVDHTSSGAINNVVTLNEPCLHFVRSRVDPSTCSTCHRRIEVHENEDMIDSRDVVGENTLQRVNQITVAAASDDDFLPPSMSDHYDSTASGLSSAHTMFIDEVTCPWRDKSAEVMSVNTLIEEVLLEFQNVLEWKHEISCHRGQVSDFFVMYEVHLTPTALLSKITKEVYSVFGNTDLQTADNLERTSRTELKVASAKCTACLFLQYWIEIRPKDWDSSPLLEIWSNFLLTTQAQNGGLLPLFVAEVEDLRLKAHGLDIKRVSRKVLAEQICILLFDEVSEVSTIELCSQGWLNNDERLQRCTNVLRVLRRHNSVSLWAASVVLGETSEEERFKCVVQLLRLAKWLQVLGCYDSVFAILKGLDSPTLKRLAKVWQMISDVPGFAKLLKQLLAFCSPSNNYAVYRREISKLRYSDFCIPYMSLLLEDIAECSKNEEDTTTFSRSKCKRLASVLSPITRLQVANHDFDRVESIFSLLVIALEPRITWDDLDAKTAALDVFPQPAPILKTVVDSMSHRTVTVSRSSVDLKHILRDIDRLVSVIFATYDVNNDGILSKSEFVHVLGNFPFLSEYSIDSDGDGDINREELRKCLRQATNIPDLDVGCNMAPQGLVNVSVRLNENPKYYTLDFHLPNGKVHTVITRYSALLSFYHEAQNSNLRFPAGFKFPPKHYFPCQYKSAVAKRKASFVELFTGLCSFTRNWDMLASRGFLPSSMLNGMRRKSRVLSSRKLELPKI
eukprot:CFRG1271T1